MVATVKFFENLYKALLFESSKFSGACEVNCEMYLNYFKKIAPIDNCDTLGTPLIMMKLFTFFTTGPKGDMAYYGRAIRIINQRNYLQFPLLEVPPRMDNTFLQY